MLERNDMNETYKFPCIQGSKPSDFWFPKGRPPPFQREKKKKNKEHTNETLRLPITSNMPFSEMIPAPVLSSIIRQTGNHGPRSSVTDPATRILGNLLYLHEPDRSSPDYRHLIQALAVQNVFWGILYGFLQCLTLHLCKSRIQLYTGASLDISMRNIIPSWHGPRRRFIFTTSFSFITPSFTFFLISSR